MNKCPACGGELTYLPEEGKVYCEYCRSYFEPDGFVTKERYASERKTTEGKIYACHECGASLLTFDETAVTFCSYCGSQSMIEHKMVKINNPDYIIPFKITKEECIEKYKKVMKKAFFVPKYMKDDLNVEKFRGIFMPYVIYTTSFHGECENNGEVYSHREGDYSIYNKYNVSAYVDMDYEGISYDGLSIFYDEYSNSIPFKYTERVDYNKNYLAGYYADTKDVEDNLYDYLAEYVTSKDSVNYLSKIKEYGSHGCKTPRVDLKVSSRKIGMFPVYFLAIRNKRNKVHYAVINGQTGDIAADLPIDFKKYLLSSIMLAIIIFLLLNNFSIILPTTVLIFSIVCAFISLFISNRQLNKIYEKENKLDDLGYLFTEDEEKMNKEIETDKKVIEKEKSKPIEFKTNGFFDKFAFLSVIFLLAVPGIIYTLAYNTISNYLLLIVGIGIVLFIINYKEKNDVFKNAHHKMPGNKKLRYLYKQIIAICLGAYIMISYPINDEPYYIGAIASLAIIILSFYDLVKEYNIFSSNKLPQLEKRGGDEK